MELKGGIAKILDKGSREPQAVRFHVPLSTGGWQQVTWGQLLGRSRNIALYLAEQGIARDSKVAVFATTRVEWAYCCAAIEACRAVFVPVYFSSTPAQTRFIVDHSDTEILFTEMALLPRLLERWREYPKVRQVVVWDFERWEQLEQAIATTNEARPELDLQLDEIRSRVVALTDVYSAGQALAELHPHQLARMVEEIEPSDVAAIIYTSGTTGEPKGVELTIHNLMSTVSSWYQVLEHAFPPEGERRDILWLPISHMSGWGILGQGTLFDYETWLSNPMDLLRILPEVKPTMLLSVPAYWEKLYALALSSSSDVEEQHAKLRELTGGALTFLLSGGAGLDREVKEFFHAAGLPMIEGYGLTECSPNVAMNRLHDFDLDSVGKPMPGVTVDVAKDGEILVKGENVFRGYYKNPEATRDCFDDDGWFHTGDLAEWTPRGFLRFKGRKKEIIATSGGKKIGPAGIEAMFAGDRFIEHVVVYGNERKYLVAMATLNQLAIRQYADCMRLPQKSFADLVRTPEVHDLVKRKVDRVNAQLASYETIKQFHIHDDSLSVDAGQLTPSLKLRRQIVWDQFRDTFEGLYAN
ncbi:MAG: long-chain fatty acid--CoA ligase [Deltaproteobacteria bacterium]|nr:long-chain fatty acid--CoA ligase [Deltaproteobacteria bacterium]